MAKAELYFTNDSGKWQDRLWKSVPAKVEGNRVFVELPSPRPTVFHLAVTDRDGNIVTTEHWLGVDVR